MLTRADLTHEQASLLRDALHRMLMPNTPSLRRVLAGTHIVRKVWLDWVSNEADFKSCMEGRGIIEGLIKPSAGPRF